MSLAILFHFLCVQHVSDIHILEFRCGLVGVVSMLQAEAQVVLQPATRIPLQPNHTKTPTHVKPRTIRPMW